MKTDLYNLQQMHLVSSMEFSVLLLIDFILITRWRLKKHANGAREQDVDQFLGFTIFLR